MVKNGNFTLLLTSSGQEWQFHIATHIPSIQEWQFHIATDMYGHEWQFPHSHAHLMVKNGNFTFLLTFSSKE